MYFYARYLVNNIPQDLTPPKNARFYTFTFCNNFLCSCKSLPDTSGMVNANGNVERVKRILFKHLEHCLPIKMSEHQRKTWDLGLIMIIS